VIDAGAGAFEVADEVEKALDAAEREIVDSYCSWLARTEATTYDRVLEAHVWLKERGDENAALREENRKLRATLDRILRGRTWRLRNSVLRILRAASRRAG
jgi:uncharacterized Zn finger protein